MPGATGIIFDFDGTLADTLPDIADAVNAGLASVGLPAQPASAVRQWIGEGLPLLCRRAVGDAADVAIDELVAVVSAHYRANSLNRTRLFPGIADLLDALTARGIPFALLTNKPHQATVPMVEALFGRWRFVAVEGYREEDRRKPDPRTALEIVDCMGFAPDRVMMVGDSFTDMATAVNAGLVPVGVTWGYRDRRELLDAGARHLIERPAELLNLIP